MSTPSTLERASAIAFDRVGTGEPLVLVHGLGGQRAVWRAVLGALAAERDVIVVDLPGFGASPPLPAGIEPSPAALAGSLAELLDELGLERAHLAGNSLGAWVCLELGKAGRALSVTGLGSAGFWKGPLRPRGERLSTRRLAAAVLPLVPVLVRSRAGRRLLLAGTVGRPERVPPADAAMLVRAYASGSGFDATNTAMRRRWLTGLERVRAPMTLAWGDRDRLTGPPRVPPPRARVVVLPGCGHVPMWDDPELVAGVLLRGSRLEPGAGRG
jgi:pimeloyl-ACP methyl ester carboxylesterase